MLKIRNLTFSRQKVIFEHISVDLKKGKVLGIVGASGAGKSSLLKVMAGLLDADSGTVHLERERIYGPAFKLIPGHPEIQLINQDFDLDLYHTVAENLHVKAQHLNKEERTIYVHELLDLLELNALKNQKAHTLSGGEQQRLAIGRALCSEPKVLLLDEPFVHLDSILKRRMINYLTELKKVRKTAFVLVSHDGQEMLSIADEIAYFNNSHFERISSPLDFYWHPRNKEEALFFGEINELIIQGKTILFRPNQFKLSAEENTIQLKVQFIDARFVGPYHENFFKFGKQKFVLYHPEILRNVREINVITH